jgi:hypothetical protein
LTFEPLKGVTSGQAQEEDLGRERMQLLLQFRFPALVQGREKFQFLWYWTGFQKLLKYTVLVTI